MLAMSEPSHLLLVACVDLAAGGKNALAGGRAFVSLPALIAAVVTVVPGECFEHDGPVSSRHQ